MFRDSSRVRALIQNRSYRLSYRSIDYVEWENNVGVESDLADLGW